MKEKQKNKLREQIVCGAEDFEKYLNNKSFLLLFSDGSQEEICFRKDDFKHLTGLQSNLNTTAFYQRCLDHTISCSNIYEEQKYNLQTLKHKATHLSSIYRMLYEDVGSTIFVPNFVTRTATFPIALNNDNLDVCVGFVKDQHFARSLRKATDVSAIQNGKNIAVIRSKNLEADDYQDILYSAVDKT